MEKHMLTINVLLFAYVHSVTGILLGIKVQLTLRASKSKADPASMLLVKTRT